MRRNRLLLFLSAVAIALAVALIGLACSDDTNARPPGQRNPVLVELFTSEGCSSCPAADELLASLIEDQPVEPAEIIGIGRHITYWDYIGHTDPFGDAVHDQRQRAYAQALREPSVYTPQAIIDGRAGVVGSSKSELLQQIRSAAVKPRLAIALERAALDGGRFAGEVTLPEGLGSAEVWLAVVESGLSTRVEAGENAGKRLGHAAVARRVSHIGSAQAGRLAFDLPAAGFTDFKKVRLVAFVQEAGPGPVLAVGWVAAGE